MVRYGRAVTGRPRLQPYYHSREKKQKAVASVSTPFVLLSMLPVNVTSMQRAGVVKDKPGMLMQEPARSG